MGKLVKKRKIISVVVPAYKAQNFIAKNLETLENILSTTKYNYEIICVVDGYIDKTKQVASIYAKKHNKVKVVGYKKNRGKGHAVRYGMNRATGDIIGFIDAGMDLEPEGLKMLLSHFEWYDADIIIGSKRHPVSQVYYPWQRKILSFTYQMVVKILFGLHVRDTQVGMKFFKKEVIKKILPRLLVKTFAFDIEMLVVADHLGYTRIYEAPIKLKMDFKESTIASKGFLKTSFWMLWDTLAVFYRLKILNYYSYKNRGKWIVSED